MKKKFPTVFHETALEYDTLYISAGKIGAEVSVDATALLELLQADTADIVTKAEGE
jgi:Cys-tRNA(Pro)/Cys-tRNA(Cys) deacylase